MMPCAWRVASSIMSHRTIAGGPSIPGVSSQASPSHKHVFVRPYFRQCGILRYCRLLTAIVAERTANNCWVFSHPAVGSPHNRNCPSLTT